MLEKGINQINFQLFSVWISSLIPNNLVEQGLVMEKILIIDHRYIILTRLTTMRSKPDYVEADLLQLLLMLLLWLAQVRLVRFGQLGQVSQVRLVGYFNKVGLGSLCAKFQLSSLFTSFQANQARLIRQANQVRLIRLS